MVRASLDQHGLTLAGEQREVARARILRAAGVALAARGLAATVDDVAGAAGVSRRTVFRHFATRDALFVTVIRAGIRRYAEQIPAPPAGDDLRGWLPDLLAVTHRLNARNGRVFWDLVGVRAADLSADLAMVAAESRDSRHRVAAWGTELMWLARGAAQRAAARRRKSTAGGAVPLTAVGDMMRGNTPDRPPDPGTYFGAVRRELKKGAQIGFGNLAGTVTTATAGKCGSTPSSS